MRKLTDKFKGFLDLFLKSSCPLCQRPAQDLLCQYCHRQLQRCQLTKVSQRSANEPVFVWGIYGGALKRAIAAMKYENHPQLAKPLGHWMGEAWLKSPLSTGSRLTVVPIPMYPQKLKERGFNQAELLAKSFCEVTNLPAQPQGLERVRQTEAQFGLSASEREQNVAGAFNLGKAFRHRHPQGSVLLLDDIYTTGSTVRAAAQTLRSAKIPVCGIVALAAPQQGDREI